MSLRRGEAASRRGLRRVSPSLVVLLALPVLLLLPVLQPGRMIFGRDLWDVFFFMHRLVADELRAGRLPTWDPHVLAGFALLAAVQAAVFYPPTWLGIVLPDAAFWNFVTWLHLALAGVFAEAWLRRGLGLDRRAALLGALVFSLAGFPYARIAAGHVTYVWAYPWGAAALWRTERFLAGPSLRRAVLLAPTVVIMALAGVPQLALATGLVVAARLVHFTVTGAGDLRGRVWTAVGAGTALAGGMLLGAPQLLPTLELTAQIQRVAAAQPGFVTTYSLPPENLLTLLAPRVFGDAAGARYWGRWFHWELCGYVGAATLVLALVGAAGQRQRRFWAGVALAALLVALGRYTPLFDAFATLVPGSTLFRAPARYLYVFTLALAALAAIGAQRLLAADAGARAAARRAGVAAVLLALLLAAGALALWILGGEGTWWRDLLAWANAARLAEGGYGIPVDQLRFRIDARATAAASLALAAAWLAVAAALLLAVARGALSGRAAVPLLALLIAADLATFDQRYVRGGETASLYWQPELTALVRRRLAGTHRLASIGPASIADAGRARLAGVDHVGGYDSMQLARYADLVNVLRERPLDTPVVMAAPGRPHPLMDMLGARVWLAPPDMPTPYGLSTIARRPERTVLESARALPRAWIVPRAIALPDAQRRLRFLGEGRWDPRNVVVLEEPPGEADAAPSLAPGTVEIASRAPGEYVLDADSPGGGYLVLAESWYPGWHATVDGTAVPVLRANHLVQAVRLPPGRHEVRFTYRSRLLPLGLALAAAALALPLAVALVRRLVAARGGAQGRDSRSNAAA
ncbi:MAG: YfhO family protein [Thermodesulfobacteriota bacterium]